MNAGSSARSGASDGRFTLLLVAEYYASGGTRTYLLQLLDYYRERGIRVILVGLAPAPDPEIRGRLEDKGWSYASFMDVMGSDRRGQASTRPRPCVWSPLAFGREKRAWRGFARSHGVQGVVVSAGTPGMLLSATAAGLPSIYILHTYPHGRRQRLLGRVLMGRYALEARRLVAVSEFQRREMVSLWGLTGRADRVVVIPNTTGELVGPSDAEAPREAVVLTASWLEPYKAPRHWLQVAELVRGRMPELAPTFLWLGDGSMLAEMRVLASKEGLSEGIRFTGHVDDVGPLYRQAAVYAQLSMVENMSLSTIDALRHGVPCVVTQVGGLPEIVADGITGYVVPPGDIGAAATAIESLLADEALRKGMSEEAQARYASVFSPRRWVARLTALHEDVFGWTA